MQVKKRFVILTHPRTGSSSLARSLSIHPDIELLGEPFHKPNQQQKKIWYINKVQDIDSFISTLDLIFDNYNGIKHFLHHVPFEYNKYIIESNNFKIIHLYRKNILKNVISGLISEQAQEWGVQKEKILRHSFKPIIIEKVSKRIHKRKYIFEKYRQYLKLNSIPYFDLCYEDLYGNHIGIDKRMDIFSNILDFLDFRTHLNEEQVNQVRSIFNPSTKLNSIETYQRIPNIHEIEKEFGSPENGFLFK